MSERNFDPDALQKRLERLGAAMGERKVPTARRRTPPPTKPPRNVGLVVGNGGVAVVVALIAVAIATHQLWLVLPAVLVGLASGVLILQALLRKDPNRAHVGMGASVADTAVIEPGATVEMGADIGPGAVVKRGAVVRMGASVHKDAIVEEGARVGWGADILPGAVVGRNAIVGAGSTVASKARLPADTRIFPGSTWSKGIGTVAGGEPQEPPAPAVDAREARIHAACDRLNDELREVPKELREHLGVNEGMVEALRVTCLDLLERERALRAECSDQSLAFLDQEAAEVERRIEATRDETARRSLRQAVAAIQDQKKQREVLKTQADRLDAEITRLSWTLDAMGPQLVRLRTAGLEARGQEPEVLRSMRQLHEEIDALADAFEEVSSHGAMEPIAPISSGTVPGPSRTRER